MQTGKPTKTPDMTLSEFQEQTKEVRRQISKDWFSGKSKREQLIMRTEYLGTQFTHLSRDLMPFEIERMYESTLFYT